jgi:hypothetical protein
MAQRNVFWDERDMQLNDQKIYPSILAIGDSWFCTVTASLPYLSAVAEMITPDSTTCAPAVTGLLPLHEC